MQINSNKSLNVVFIEFLTPLDKFVKKPKA